MTGSLLVALTTVSGAAVFFVMGFVAAGFRKSRGGAGAPSVDAATVQAAQKGQERAEGQLRALEAELSTAKGQLEAQASERGSVEAIGQELAAERRQREGAQRAQQEQHQQLEGLRAELASAQKELAAQPSVDEAPTQVGAVPEILQAELDDTRAEVTKLKSQLSQRAAAEADLKSLRDEHSRIANDLEARSSSLNKANQELAAAQRRISELEGQVDGGAKSAGQLTVVEAELVSIKQTSHKELTRLKSELTRAKELASKAEISTQLTATHKAELERMNEELQRLRGADQQALRLRKQLDRLKGERDGTERSAELLQSKEAELAHLTDELQRLRGADQESLRLHKEVSELKDQLSALRQKAQLSDNRGEEVERLLQENQSLREEQRERSGLGDELSTVQGQLREMQVAAQAAESRRVEVERLLDENLRLRERLGELERVEQHSQKLQQLEGEHQSLRIERQTMERRLAELDVINAETVELRARVFELEREAEDGALAKRALEALEAQLFSLGHEPSRPDEVSQSKGEPKVLSEGGRISEVLSLFAKTEGLRSAVVGDYQGLLVGGAGSDQYHEEMAALSGLAEGLAGRVKQMLPMDDIRRIIVSDAHETVLSLRFFLSGREVYVLSALTGGGAPPLDVEDTAVSSLLAELGD